MRQSKDAKDIVEKVLRVFDRVESGKTILEIRVVSWIIDGKVMSPGLEKREKFRTENGERIGKAKSFNIADLALIKNHWDEIMSTMQARPAELKVRQPVGAKPEPF